MLNRATFSVPSNHSSVLAGTPPERPVPIVIALHTGASEQAITPPKSLTTLCRTEVDLRDFLDSFNLEALPRIEEFEKPGRLEEDSA